jgi:predicted RNA binding protein YcfA (HicA-like mRNA interferase family)
MTRLPRPTGKEMIRALGRAGFSVDRTRGSQKHADGRATAVPVHSGETLGPGLLRSILRDVELSVEQLVDLL